MPALQGSEKNTAEKERKDAKNGADFAARAVWEVLGLGKG
jgi:hypothetical protein